jgi:hypothetical protein
MIVLYLLSDPSLTAQDRCDIEMHIWQCPKCAQRCDESKEFMTFLMHYYAFRKGLAFSQITLTLAKRPRTFQESLEEMKRRSPSYAEACRRGEEKKKLQRSQRLRWAASVAACVLIGTAVCWWSWPRNNATIAKVEPDAPQLEKVSEPEPDSALAKESSVGGLESSPSGGDGPLTAAVKKDLKDTDS